MLRRNAFAMPAAALVLTLGGLVPFIAGAMAVLVLASDPARQAAAQLALLAYTATILSFLGGGRWGMEIAKDLSASPRFWVLAGSVLGALAGWLLVLQAVLGGLAPWLFLVGAGLIVLHWAWDVIGAVDTPAWYDGLRTLASIGAAAALLGAYAVV